VAYENRLSTNYTFGTLSQAAAIADPTLNSADFATRLPSGLSTTTYVPITLQDPSTGNYEIVWATAHTAAATSATVLRGREATTARAWASGTLWTVSPTVRDGLLPVANRAALPNDAHVGLRAELQDEQLVVTYVQGAGFQSGYGLAYRDNKLLAADTATVLFSNIPAALKRIEIAWVARSTKVTTSDPVCLRVNGDATVSYPIQQAIQTGNANPGYAQDTSLNFSTVGYMPAETAAVGCWATGMVFIEGWNAPPARTQLSWQTHSNYFDTAANAVHLWNSGSFTKPGPYTSLSFVGYAGALFKAGSEFTLYGWA
jgi:hypothetical protein